MTGALEPIDPETLRDLYERAPCGYLSTRPDGTIVHANQTIRDWVGVSELTGTDFRDLLTVGGRMFYETNFAPLVHLQDEVRDFAVDLRRQDGTSLPVLISSTVVEAPTGTVIRSTLFDATLRREQERQLRAAGRRAEESERQMREVALRLQHSLLAGSITQAPGFRVETRYRPATDELEIGGDWYDAFSLPDRQVVSVSVGDVVGRGIGAACAMGQVRSALRAIALSGVGPGRTLDQLDTFAEHVPGAQSATVVCAELDPADRWVRYACAGHLPPLLLSADGTSSYLWDGRSLPLASMPQTGVRPEGEIALEPGSSMLLYTDGLIERRDRGLDEGLATLAHLAAELSSLPPAELVDALMVELLRDEVVRDDVCLLHLALAEA